MRKVILAIGACCAFGAVHADERNPLEARFIVDAGTFFMSQDTEVRLNGETTDQIGTPIDYDETFGLGDFDRFRVDGMWRIADRHLVRGMYFKNSRSGTRNMDREVNFGDETYPIGASVTAESEMSIYQLSYEYAFLRRQNYELAGGIGVHYMDMGLSTSATLSVQGSTTGSRQANQDANTGAPLPVLGLRWLWRVSNNFYVNAQAQYFYIEFDPYSGSLADLKASVVWQPTDHVGLGVGYNAFRFNFDIEDKPKFDGSLQWDYGGAIVFASFMF